MPDHFTPDDLDPHVQWATDPSGRRYWIQGVPSFGGNPLAPIVSAVKALFLGGRRPAQVEPEVGGVVMVTRVDGDESTEVLCHCDTLEEARAEAKRVAGEIEAGTFQERPPGGR